MARQVRAAIGHGGDVRGFTENLRRIHENLPADVKIIPGHGPLSTKEDLAESIEMPFESS